MNNKTETKVNMKELATALILGVVMFLLLVVLPQIIFNAIL